VTDQVYAEVFEIVGGQIGQSRGVDRVVAKRLFVLLQSEAAEPGCDVHARLHAAITVAPGNLTYLLGPTDQAADVNLEVLAAVDLHRV